MAEAVTLEVTRYAPRPGENRALQWRLIGFVGNLWVSLPFETRSLAEVYAVGHGWPYKVAAAK